MANVAHSTITDPYIHEPKGADDAASGEVYRADGAGSGSWEAPLKLIERRIVSSSVSEIEFTGLSAYRALYIAISNITLDSSASATYLGLQLSTASTYRTSGYIGQYLTDGANATNGYTSALTIGTNDVGSANGWGFIELCNLNAAYPTSVRSMWVTSTVNRYSSSTAGTSKPHNLVSLYPTAEAHEKIKFTNDNSYNFTQATLDIYGIN